MKLKNLSRESDALYSYWVDKEQQTVIVQIHRTKESLRLSRSDARLLWDGNHSSRRWKDLAMRLEIYARYRAYRWALRSSGTVKRPPGSSMLAIADLFPKKIREDILAQIVADLREEYFQALKHKARPGELRYIVARGRVAFAVAIGLVLLRGVGNLVKILKGAG